MQLAATQLPGFSSGAHLVFGHPGCLCERGRSASAESWRCALLLCEREGWVQASGSATTLQRSTQRRLAEKDRAWAAPAPSARQAAGHAGVGAQPHGRRLAACMHPGGRGR